MSNSEIRVPTLEECLELWDRKTWLEKEIAMLEEEQVGLRAAVDYLRSTEHTLRVKSANLCYDLSALFELMGKLADAEKTRSVDKISDEFNF